MEGRSHKMDADGSYPEPKVVRTSKFRCVHCRS